MSHFSVIVVGNDIERQLQPYHEYECTDVLDEFVVFVDETEQMEEEFRTKTMTMLVDSDGNAKFPHADEFYRDPTPEEEKIAGMGSGFGKGIVWTSRDWNDGRGYRAKIRFIPEDHIKKEIPVNKIYKSVEEYCRDYHGYRNENFKEGRIGRMTNPNAKWDYWGIGGRWDGVLISNGKEVNSALKKDVDIAAMEKPQVDHATKVWGEWHSNIRQMPDGDKEKKDWIYKNIGWFTTKKDIEKLESMSKEEYVACMSMWAPYAVVWNGKWYAKGEMGWFACSTNEESNWSGQFKQLWKEIPDSEMITIVDCHI
jgi:hypothetical protein